MYMYTYTYPYTYLHTWLILKRVFGHPLRPAYCWFAVISLPDPPGGCTTSRRGSSTPPSRYRASSRMYVFWREGLADAGWCRVSVLPPQIPRNYSLYYTLGQYHDWFMCRSTAIDTHWRCTRSSIFGHQTSASGLNNKQGWLWFIADLPHNNGGRHSWTCNERFISTSIAILPSPSVQYQAH